MPFQDYKQFIELFNKSTLEDKPKTSEFYLHNLALTNLNVWDPNAKLGDLPLMALASWMSHEEVRAKEVKMVLEREERKPLYIIAEQINSMVVISIDNIIANNPQLAPRYLATQEKAITHFENILRLLGNKSQQACQRRWGTLPYNLRIREYHSPERMRDALERTPLYKNSL